MNELFDFIKDYGGYAGAASVLGLAVLSLLYFAQAREVKRLREWAGRAPERAAELEQRVTSDATRRTITPMPQRTPPPRPGQPQTAAAQAKPAVTNGQAPGTPAPAPAPAGATAAAAAAPTAAAGPAVAAPAAAASPTATPAEKPDDESAATKPDEKKPAAPDTDSPTTAQPPEATASAPPAPKPATPPATPPPAAATTPPSPPRPVPPAAPGPRTAAARPRPAAPAQALRTTTPSATVPPRNRGGDQPRRTLGIVAGVLALLAVGLVLVFVLGGDDDPERVGDQPPAGNTETSTVDPPADETPPRENTRAARGDTKVAVFNATTVNGLADRVADEVEASGWARDEVSNAPPPPKSATLVYYAEGEQAQARQVARVIGVGGDAVQRMDQNVRALDDDAQVIVIVGADQQQG